jgi:hypothetical protein
VLLVELLLVVQLDRFVPVVATYFGFSKREANVFEMMIYLLCAEEACSISPIFTWPEYTKMVIGSFPR